MFLSCFLNQFSHLNYFYLTGICTLLIFYLPAEVILSIKCLKTAKLMQDTVAFVGHRVLTTDTSPQYKSFRGGAEESYKGVPFAPSRSRSCQHHTPLFTPLALEF